MNPLATDVNHWLGDGRAGLNLKLIGHGSSATVLLPLSHLPYVQLYKRREPSSTVDRRLAMDLYECRGDTSATTQVLIMLGYYKWLSQSKRKGALYSSPSEKDANTDSLKEMEPSEPTTLVKSSDWPNG